uniref:Uncharacterized protein n=1 Tax=Arundo donax TaxID=35708 RepID=A0A0A9AQL5_ARUDO
MVYNATKAAVGLTRNGCKNRHLAAPLPAAFAKPERSERSAEDKRVPSDDMQDGINNLALEPWQHASPGQKRRHLTRGHGGSSEPTPKDLCPWKDSTTSESAARTRIPSSKERFLDLRARLKAENNRSEKIAQKKKEQAGTSSEHPHQE